MEVSQNVERLILSSLPTGRRSSTIGEDEDLLAGGAIDSVSLMELVAALEAEFGIELGDDDLVMDNFRTVRDIERLVKSKRQAAV